MKYLYILLAFTFINVSANSPVLFSAIDQQIVFCTFNMEVDKADMLIKEQLANNADNPKYYFLQVGNEVMRAIMIVNSTHSDRKRKVRDSLNTAALALTQKAVDKFENIELTTENKFFLGGLYGYLGRFYGIEKSWFSAFSDGKTGKNLLEEVIEENPSYYDAHLLLGMFYYYADRLGGVIGFIAGILGFSGDRDEGIEYMRTTAEKGDLIRPQANMLLSEVYSRLEDNNFKAFPYFERLINTYPNNSYFLNNYIRELLDVEMAKRVGDLIKSDSLNLIDDYNKGRYFHLIGNYKRSQEYLEIFKPKKDFYWRWYSRTAMLISSLNNWILGNMETAISDTTDMNRRYRDRFEFVTANDIESRKLFEFRAVITRMENTTEIKNIIDSRTPHPNNQFEGHYLFSIARFYFYQNDYEKAEKYFLEAKKLNPDLEYDCCRFLVEVYLRFTVPTENVENLVEYIDDLESESLEWSAKDLESKYDL